MFNNKISIVKNKKDLYLNFNNNDDKFILITGVSESGKSTLARQLSKEKNCHKVSLDLAFWHENGEITEIEELVVSEFKNKYPEWDSSIFKGYADYKNNVFKEYANLFYDFIIECFEDTDKLVIIEGSHIFKYINIEKIRKRKIIVKRTSFVKSSIRKNQRIVMYANRDLKNKDINIIKYFKEILTGLKQATIKQIKWYRLINQFIDEIVQGKGNNYE